MRQQQMLQHQRQQQMIQAQQSMYGNMANGMPMGQQMGNVPQMTAQQFAQLRNGMNGGMRPVGVPAHLQQAHLAQQGQHPHNAQQQAVSSSFHRDTV